MDKKYIFVGVLILILGILIGRWSTPTEKKVQYLKFETISDTVSIKELVPYKVETPSKPKLITRVDTIILKGGKEFIVEKVDSAQIIAEFIKKNYYERILFDNDTLGMIKINTAVQYNKLQYLGYEYTPIQKQITIYKERKLVPFLSTSYNSFGIMSLGAGIYHKNMGFRLNYLRKSSDQGWEFGLNYKL